MPDGSTDPPPGPGSCLLINPKLETSMPLRGDAMTVSSNSRPASGTASRKARVVRSMMKLKGGSRKLRTVQSASKKTRAEWMVFDCSGDTRQTSCCANYHEYILNLCPAKRGLCLAKLDPLSHDVSFLRYSDDRLTLRMGTGDETGWWREGCHPTLLCASEMKHHC